MFACEIQERAAQSTLTMRVRTPVETLPARLGEIYATIAQYMEELGEASPQNVVFTLYYNMDMSDLDIEAGFAVSQPYPAKDAIQPGTVPAGLYAICHYTGSYEDMAPAYDALAEFAQAEGCIPSGIAYEWYFDGPDVPPAERKTDIYFR